MNEDNLALTVINEHYLTCTLSFVAEEIVAEKRSSRSLQRADG